MGNIRRICGAVASLIAVSYALPALPKLSNQMRSLYDRSAAELAKRQNPATGLPDGIGDVDILQFALTLENLETAFYQQGFAQFPDSEFLALGLNENQLSDLKSIQLTEQTHITTLNSAVAGTGTQPVQACTYNFGFTDAASMVATAGTLESVGISAYLGAAPLLKSAAILSVAAQIVTVEARHQTFVRTASRAVAIPAAFDTSLGIRNVFSLAAAFIASCPSGSNLAITPFPALAVTNPPPGENVAVGTQLTLQSDATDAPFCAFTNGGVPGGTLFVASVGGQCVVPQGVAGITYLNLANADPGTGVLSDDITLAGPVALTVS